MKLRVTDSKKGISSIDLKKPGSAKRRTKADDEELEEYKPPPLWTPKPENHDPHGGNER